MNLVTCRVGDKYSEEQEQYLVDVFRDYYPEANHFSYQGELLDVPGVWNKLMLFKATESLEGDCIFLDLDSTMRDVIPIPTVQNGRLTLVSAYWKRDDPAYRFDRYDTIFNSSVMHWKAGTCVEISDYFEKDHEHYTSFYKGIDRFLFWEPIDVNLFEDGVMSSNKDPFIGWSSVITYNGEDYGQYFEGLKQARDHR